MEELLSESQLVAGVGSWEWEAAENRVIWSDELFRIFGLEPQSTPATFEGYLERVHPEDRARVQAAVWKALQEQSSFDHDERIVRADGSVRWLHSRGRALHGVDGSLRMVGTCQDITERRRVEREREQLLIRERQARRDSESARRLISSVLERVSDGFVSLDSDWHYTHVNDKAAAMFGRRAEDLVGKHIWTEFPEGVGQKFHRAYEKAMREQVPVFLEEFYPPWNRWYENRIYPSKDGLSVFFQDVTERRMGQEALRESRERFREIAENVAEAFWVMSPDFKTLYYLSPAFEEIFGIPSAPLDKVLPAWCGMIHPEDREVIHRTLSGDFKEGWPEGTYRIVRPDGGLRWIRWRSFPVRDESGQVVRVTGFSEDITTLKETEDALRRAQAQLADALHVSQDRVVQLEEQVRSRSTFERLVGKSAPMQEVYRKLRLAAQSDVTVLITGESGTGKELAAAAIHSLSERKSKPFVAVNCSAIPESLLESELFGHVKGAFTGAIRDKVGLFQAADGGTLFLDEVAEMAPQLQVKVLRALQEREIRRVGDERVTKINVRIVAATNRDLERLVLSEKLREDFYYRIRVFDIPMPPLRERRDDIPLLVHHFLHEIGAGKPRSSRGMTAEGFRALMNYSWPGNVRELRNAVEHGMVTASGREIRLDDLPSQIQHVGDLEAALTPEQYAERERLITVLREAGGNRTKAAALLGTSRVTLWKKMRRFRLDIDPDKPGLIAD
jgi:PAS domain S-box-containing protein